MICPSCSVAGDYNRLFNQAARQGDPDLITDVLKQKAREHHDYCVRGLCDCQHVVGMVIDNGQPR